MTQGRFAESDVLSFEAYSLLHSVDKIINALQS